MLKKFILLATILFQSSILADTKKEKSSQQDLPKNNSPQFFIDYCEKNSNQEKFLKNLAADIMKSETRRKEFIAGLAQKKFPNCENILKEYIKKIISETDYTPKAGEQALLSLALVAKIPEATKMIELEIDKGYLSSWIDVLKETDEQGYLLSLKSWIKRVATEIREKDNTKLRAESDYGKIPANGNEIKYPDMVRIWTPILMNRYLTEIMSRQQKLTVEEFGDLNIIFAASTASYRDTFIDPISQIVAHNSKDWLISFRKEEPWVEFRLFPIMQKLGKKDGYIRREIIWLAKNHQDPKLKSLATATLDNIVTQKSNSTAK